MRRAIAHNGTYRRPALVLLLVAGLIAAVTAACGGSKQNTASTAASTSLRQSSDAGNVTVDVTWKGRAAGPVFTVALDTHSVDLD